MCQVARQSGDDEDPERATPHGADLREGLQRRLWYPGGAMTLTIDLTPAPQERLRAAARDLGLSPGECAHQILVEHLPLLQDPVRSGGVPL
jgi:hypothetical protein